MRRSLLVVTLTLALCAAASAQGGKGSYYEAVVAGGGAGAPRPAELKRLEEGALKEFSNADAYYALAKAFGGTTEKVWAVIYAEAFCNLAPESEKCGELGALAHGWYERAFTREGNEMSVTLSENAEVDTASKRGPFEADYEISLLLGFVAAKGEFSPLSVRTLAETRRQQLAVWKEKRLPKTELVRRLEAIASAGHFEAYNYWLFRNARPEEFKQWQDAHQAQYKQWLDWQAKNRFAPQKPDFQRLSLLRRS